VKKRIFLLYPLTVLVFTLANCDNAANNNGEDLFVDEHDLTNITVKEKPCEKLGYIGKIGNDFDSALDSLIKVKNISSEIFKDPLETLFDFDDREFYGIMYGDCGMYSDVLDTKGNYYSRSWYCPGVFQEELIFKENKTFPIEPGSLCPRILYMRKIGNDFDSALDSLMKEREQFLQVLTAEGHYSGKGYNVEKQTIDVVFDYDNRMFILLTIIDKANIYNYLYTGDVIDSKGNYFRYSWCHD